MSAVRRASTHLLAQRSVHIKIVPRPANLGESREIFRILQRFGEMTLYKHLRYEYHNPADNIAIAIYRETESAQKAIDNSPLRFSIDVAVKGDEREDRAVEEIEEEGPETPKIPQTGGIEEMLTPGTLVNRASSASVADDSSYKAKVSPGPFNPISSSPAPLPFAPEPSVASLQKRFFQVTIDRSRVIHQDFVERQPLWKQFEPMKSMAQEDLSKKVPHVGLSDVSRRPLGAHRTPNFVLGKLHKYTQDYMPTPLGMWEEGGREKSEEDGSR